MENIFENNKEFKTKVISTKITEKQYIQLELLCNKYNIKKGKLLNNLITKLLEENK